MSYILNALRKSEQERQAGNVDTLENRIQDKQQSGTKKTSSGLIALVVLNFIFLVCFVWFYTQDQVAADKTEVLIPVKSATMKEKPALKIEEKLVVIIPAIVEQPLEIPQLSIAEQIKSQKAKRKPVNTAKAEIKPSLQKVEKNIEAIKQLKPSLKQTPDVKVIVDKQQDNIPFLSTLDYEFRRKVPDIDINVYVYAEKQQNRFIMIEMQKYLSGQQIASGMTLKEIRMNSLVVEYKNREFQIKRK